MAPKLPLPHGWKCRIRSSVLHILDLGHYHLLEQRTLARRTWTSAPLFDPRRLFACPIQRREGVDPDRSSQ